MRIELSNYPGLEIRDADFVISRNDQPKRKDGPEMSIAMN